MADGQDYSQDKGFMAASPEDQHAYLMSVDKGYAGASAQDQKAFLAHLRGQTSSAGRPANQTGAMQTEKGGRIVNAAEADVMKLNQAGEKRRAQEVGEEATEHAVAGSQPFGEVALGAAKGALSTGRGLGHLATKIPLLGPKLAAADQNMASGEAPEALKPHGIQQGVGFGGEQAAEFAIPGGAVEKGAKLAETGIDAARLAPVASRALKLLSRGGLEAAGAGGVTAAQGGDVKTNAALAGMLPFVSAALKKPAEALAEKAAPALANKLLRPVPTQLENAARFGRNPGQAIADEGIIATSHNDLVSRIADRKEDIGNRIGTMLKTATGAKPIDAGAIVNKNVDEAIKDVLSGKLEGGQGLVDRLEEMRAQLTQQRQLVNGKVQNLSPKNLNLSAADAHALKRQIGDSAKWTGQAFDGEVNQVKRAIYRDLNSEIQKQVPGVKVLQDRYGNLLEAERAAEREAARHEARLPFGLVDTLAGVGGASISAATGHNPLWGAAIAAANKALRSPLARTVEVQGLKKAPMVLSPEVLRGVRNAILGARSDNRQ